MPNQYTNLLPPERISALNRDYRLRLIVVSLWFIVALALIASTLLVPTYILLTQSVNEKEERLKTLALSLKLADAQVQATRLDALSNKTEALIALGKQSSASETVRSVLALPRPGITISSFFYKSASKENEENKLTISGMSATRASLRDYQLVLEKAPFIRSAFLPVAAFARDTDVPFSIQITLNP